MLPTEVHIVEVTVFPVVIYGCESWNTEKTEHQRIDALKLWCWRRLLRVPWTARRSNQSILKEINLDYSLERLMLKLQYFGHLMWELDYKESWVLKNWCFWTVVLEKTLESLLDCKEIQPVHPKGDQSWVFIGRIDAETETPIFCPPDAKNWLIGKEPDAGKIEGRRRRGHRGWDGWMASPTRWTWVWLNSGSWWWIGRPGVLQFAESDTTERLNWTVLIIKADQKYVLNN